MGANFEVDGRELDVDNVAEGFGCVVGDADFTCSSCQDIGRVYEVGRVGQFANRSSRLPRALSIRDHWCISFLALLDSSNQ